MKNVLVVLICFICSHAKAQQSVVDEEIGWKGAGVQLHTVSDKIISCTYIIGFDSIKALVMDSNANIIDRFTLKRHGLTNFFGSFISGDNIYLYVDNGEQPGVLAYALNMTNHTVKENVIKVKLKRHKMIDRLSSDHHFIFMTLNKKTDEFCLFDFKDENTYVTHSFPLERLPFVAAQNASAFTTQAASQHVNMEGECDIEIARFHLKSYFLHDTLVIISNKQKNTSTVYEFDLATMQVRSRAILHQADSTNLYAAENSFLFNNKLYYVAARAEELRVQVLDFYSGNILKEYMATADEEIPFKNTSIVQEGGGFGGKRELGKTRQLLRKMTNGDAVILANSDKQGEVTVMVGSYQVQNTGGAGTMMPGLGMGMGMATVYVSMGLSRGGGSKSARFKMMLDETNEFIAGEIPATINEQVDIYSKSLKIPPEGENLIRKNDGYYYCYYDKRDRHFHAVRFPF